MASVADSGEAQAARVAAAILVMGVGGFIALVLPPVGLPVAAAASAWLLARRGPSVAVAATVLVGAATVVADRVGPLYIMPWLLVAGPATAVLLRRARFESVVLIITVAIAAVWAGAVVGAAATQGSDVASIVRQGVQEMLGQGLPAPGGGVEGAQGQQQLDELVDTAVRLMPSTLVFIAGVTAIACVAAVVRVLRGAGIAVSQVPPLAAFDVDPRVVWGLIAAIVFLAADKFSGAWRGGVLGVAGENLLLTMRWVLFAQGIAVFAGLYERTKVSKAGRAFGYAALAITEAVLPLVSLTGLLDVWLNLRKLPRDGRTEVPAPPG